MIFSYVIHNKSCLCVLCSMFLVARIMQILTLKDMLSLQLMRSLTVCHPFHTKLSSFL